MYVLFFLTISAEEHEMVHNLCFPYYRPGHFKVYQC